MPDVIRVPRDNHELGGSLGGRQGLLRRVVLPEPSPDRGGAEMQSSSTEELGDLRVAEGRTENFQALNDVGDEVRKPVAGYSELDDRAGAFFVQSPRPGRNRGRRDEKAVRGLGQRPAAGGPKFENGQAFHRRVVRPVLGRDSQHPRILYSELLLEQAELLAEAVVLGLEPDARVPAVGRPAAGGGQSYLGQRDGVDGGRSDVLRPTSRQGGGENGRRFCHERPRSSSVDESTRGQDNSLGAMKIGSTRRRSESLAPPLSLAL